MSYDSAVLFRLKDQSTVSTATVLELVKTLASQGYLPFDAENCSCTMSYYHYDEEQDDEIDESEEVDSALAIEAFIKTRQLEFCTLEIDNPHQVLKQEFHQLLAELRDTVGSSLAPAYDFTYGFGNLMDPVAGDRQGYSFYIEASGYVPDFRDLRKVFEKSTVMKVLVQILEKVFGSAVEFDACLLG